MSSTKYELDIDSHVVIQLGAELISDSEQALLELVKNAYDSDAKHCTIRIEPDWRPSAEHPWHDHLDNKMGNEKKHRIGRIVVRDNGTGISDEGIRRGWLLISASIKRGENGEKKKTELLRTPVGDKGLGRLATMRLGDVLFLRTMLQGERKSRSVSFAWSAFKTGSTLSTIQVLPGTDGPLQNRSKGTDVEILGLHEPEYWDSDSNINSVIGKMSSLISPFKRFKDFRVDIWHRGDVRNLESIGSEALNHASAKFKFNFDGQQLKLKAWFAKSLFRGAGGRANRAIFEKLLADEKIPTVIKYFSSLNKIKDKKFTNLFGEPGGWLFSLEEDINFGDIPRDPRLPNAKNPGSINGEIYYFLFNDETKEQLQVSGIPIDMLQNMTSVGMFRDGFRVRMNDDWLELAKSSTSGNYFQLRPRNVIGFFSISNELNPGLIEKSDREGFVDNEPWRGFLLLASRVKKFSNDTLDAVRTAYDEYKKKAITTENSDQIAAQVAVPKLLELHRANTSRAVSNAKIASTTASNRIDAVHDALTKLRGVDEDKKVLQTIERQLRDTQLEVGNLHGAVQSLATLAGKGFGTAEHLSLSFEQLSEQNLRLIDAAAVGLSARALAHEIRTHLFHISKAVQTVARATRSHADEVITDSLSRIREEVRELKKVVSTINPLLETSRSLKDVFYVRELIDEFFYLRNKRLEELNITYEIFGGKGLHIRFSRTRFMQILENLLQNSVYWIQEHSQEDEQIERKVYVEITRTGFIWNDGAKGVREALEESLFEPYVTDKPSTKGQGLGMFITTAFLHAERSGITLLPERNSVGRRYKFRVDLTGASV